MVKKKKSKKKGRGRPTAYKPEYNEQAYKLSLLGFRDEDLAKFFGVNEDTINRWKKEHKQFSVSVLEGKDIADAEVAKAMHKRALGYKYDEVTYEKINMDVDGMEETEDIKLEAYKKKVVTKEVAPDAGAALNWLKNRQKKNWRDKIETGVTDSEGNDIPIETFRLPLNNRPVNNHE